MLRSPGPLSVTVAQECRETPAIWGVAVSERARGRDQDVACMSWPQTGAGMGPMLDRSL